MLVRSCRGLLLFGGARLTAVSRPAEADRLSTPRTASPKRVQPKPAPPAEEEEPPPYWCACRLHIFLHPAPTCSHTCSPRLSRSPIHPPAHTSAQVRPTHPRLWQHRHQGAHPCPHGAAGHGNDRSHFLLRTRRASQAPRLTPDRRHRARPLLWHWVLDGAGRARRRYYRPILGIPPPPHSSLCVPGGEARTPGRLDRIYRGGRTLRRRLQSSKRSCRGGACEVPPPPPIHYETGDL